MEIVNLRLYQEPQDSGPSASRDVFSLCGAKAALRRLSFNFWIMNRFPWLIHREKEMRCELGRSNGGQGRSAGRRAIPTNALLLELSSHGSSPPAMDQSLARRTLQELIKREDLKNKSCVDCGNPNPQWASLRFTPFVFSTRQFPKSVPSASPYLSACNARGFIEASACTSGELIYVIVSGFFNEYVHA